MIVTHSADLPELPLPNTALDGVLLVRANDVTRFTVYEARIPANATVPLRSPDSEKNIHFYYCISGVGTCETVDGTKHEVSPDTVVALSSDVTYTMTVSTQGGMRLLVVYYPDVKSAYRSLQLVRSQSEIVGTERDIDWGNGHSRRYIIKQDGFPLSLHNTWVYPKTSSKLAYPKHIEGVYYISGKVTYSWEDTSGEWIHEKAKTEGEQGTNYLMNKHDKHIVKTDDEDAFCICIFDPVLTGRENHRLTEEGFSVFDA